MKLNLNVGDRVVKIDTPNGCFCVRVYHGNVVEIGDSVIKCRILVDTWRLMEFDRYGLSVFGSFILPVAPYSWLYDEKTVWWEQPNV